MNYVLRALMKVHFQAICYFIVNPGASGLFYVLYRLKEILYMDR